MNISAAGYILLVPQDRREILLYEAEEGSSLYRSTPFVAEPVSNFNHSRRAPLIVFASFGNKQITHIAEGRRGNSAGTGLSRLNLYDLTPLYRPIGFDEILTGVGARIYPHLQQVMAEGGILPPKTFEAFVSRIVDLDKSVSDRLANLSAGRRAALNRLAPNARSNLAFQKEALGLALQISGFSRDKLTTWKTFDDSQRSFLDGLPGVQVREDTMLLKDFSTLPGFESINETTHYGTKVFENSGDSSVRMTVIMANRLPLEQQTGADLIYFNEAHRCFVMVQYKAMEGGNNGPEFRWQDGDQFIQEVKRMENLVTELKTISSSNSPDNFRFSGNPFFLKFCPRAVFNPDDRGLFKGIYLPLELWRRLEGAGNLKGARGGNVLTYRNVGRRISNTEFVDWVRGSWVGTSVEQSAILCKIIREVLASGRTITFAVKHIVEEYGTTLSEVPDNDGSDFGKQFR